MSLENSKCDRKKCAMENGRGRRETRGVSPKPKCKKTNEGEKRADTKMREREKRL
jgi:hypothetical protein